MPELSIPPEKICILRLSALGDVTHVLPVVRAIEQQWPHAEITWICGAFEYKLLKTIKNIRFITFNKKAGVKAYFELWKKLKHTHFDVLLQMQVAARANIASLGIKANIRLGWDKSRSRDLHSLFISRRVAQVTHQHQVQGFLSFAKSLGLSVDEPIWDIPVTADAQAFADRYIEVEKPLLIISACSSHKLRNWMAERYARFADYAISQYNMQVILSGGPAKIEVDMASEISRHMQQTPLNLVGKDTLEQLVGLLGRAAVVVSPDSGPASKRSGPYGSLGYCVDKFLNSSAEDLRWGTKIEQPGVMEMITVEEVCQQLDRLMLSSVSGEKPGHED